MNVIISSAYFIALLHMDFFGHWNVYLSQAQEAEESGDHISCRNYSQKALNLNISAIALYVILALSISIIVISHFIVFIHINTNNDDHLDNI